MIVKDRYTYHPACLAFPMLADDELKALAEDIRLRGLQNPVVRFQGQILDGRNRLAACALAGVKPTFVDWDGHGSPTEWVIATNLIRRHLTASQRAVVALEILPLLEQEAKERQRLGRGKKVAHECAKVSGKASEIAARLTRSGSRYVEAVKSIQATAPDLVEKIRCGQLSVPDAKRLANLSPRQRQKVLQLGLDGEGKYRRKGFFRNPPELRRPLDFYPTPPHATQALLDRERFTGLVLEPACGDGAMVRVLRKHGYGVEAADLQGGQDFFERTAKVANIITNPPYCHSLDFILHAKELATNKIAMLLPVEFLHGATRYELFQDRGFPLKVVYVFSSRLYFGTVTHATVGHAWYVWDRRHEGEPTLRWIR